MLARPFGARLPRGVPLCCAVAARPRAAGGLSPHPGAIATIGALKLANKGWKVELVTFGSPRVGNASFSSLTKKLQVKSPCTIVTAAAQNMA